MKLQLLLLALALLIEPVHLNRIRAIDANSRVIKKPNGQMKAEFLGSVSCPLNIVWCVQLLYMEEDNYIHEVIKQLPFICSYGSRTLTNYVGLDYYGTDSLIFDDAFEPRVSLYHDCSKNNQTYRYDHKHWRQAHHINCSSYDYDFNLLELGEAVDLDDSRNKPWTQRNRTKTYDMPAPWGRWPAKFPTDYCVKMNSK